MLWFIVLNNNRITGLFKGKTTKFKKNLSFLMQFGPKRRFSSVKQIANLFCDLPNRAAGSFALWRILVCKRRLCHNTWQTVEVRRTYVAEVRRIAFVSNK
jgi:hypothetical protein